MKKQKTKKYRRKKYAIGTAIRNYMENPGAELQQHYIDSAKAQHEAEMNPLVNILRTVGQVGMQYGMSKLGDMKDIDFSQFGKFKKAGYGGNISGVPVEIEGEEVGETPKGKVFEAKGPSHENGGIDISLPEGTEMYSKRIKVDDISMADRKKKRKKKSITLEELIKKNQTDIPTKNSYDRTKMNNAKEEEADLKIQEFIAKLLNGEGTLNEQTENNETKKLHVGTGENGIQREHMHDPLDPLNFSNLFSSSTDKYHLEDNGISEYINKYKTPVPSLSTTPINNNLSKNGGLSTNAEYALDSYINKKGNDSSGEDKSTFMDKLKNIFKGDGNKANNLTFGDALGIGGNLYQTFAPYLNTLKNRASDTPNINSFEQYGKKGLQTLDKTKGYIESQKDENLRELELARRGAINRGRNTARGVNTMRALDLIANQRANNQQSKIYNAFTQQMMNIIAQQSQMENRQDQMVMQGEAGRDLADRQDNDNFYTQLGKDKVNLGEGISRTGKTLNKVKARGVKQKFLDDYYDYLKTDVTTGETTQKEKMTLIAESMSEMVEEFDYKEAGHTKKEWDKLTDEEKKTFVMGSILGGI